MNEAEDIEAMRLVGKMAAKTLRAVQEIIKPKISTNEINEFVHKHTLSLGGYPAPLNYHGFLKSVCTSVNDVVCHGVPSDYVLQDKDIVNVDITTKYNGYHGDTSKTFLVGTGHSEKTMRLICCARDALDIGIKAVKPGISISAIGKAIEDFVRTHKFSVVRKYTGHGIGKNFHQEPEVYHCNTDTEGPIMREGMIFTIEPMINAGRAETYVDEKDKWSVRTLDKSLSAQFEHTILVTKYGAKILTI